MPRNFSERDGMTVSAEIVVRDMNASDRDQVKEILEQSFEGWYLREGLKGIDSSDRVLVAEVSGKVAGMAELRFYNAGEMIGIVYYLATHPSYRELGIASRLLDDALKLFKEKGTSLALCSIEHENQASVEFFSKHGFKETSVRSLASKYKIHFFGILRRALIVPGETIYTKNVD